jgi:hypothetical protein
MVAGATFSTFTAAKPKDFRGRIGAGQPRMGTALATELTQMMVDVFVHEDGPLLRFERTKERVWVLGAACCAPGGEAIDSCDELGAFALEVALCGVRREELLRGG